MSNSDMLTSQMTDQNCYWRTTTMRVLDSQAIPSGGTFITNPLFLVDNGFESLHIVVVGALSDISVTYECDNSNKDENFTLPYSMDGSMMGEIINFTGEGSRFEVISLVPSMRKRFKVTNSGAGSAVVSIYLNMVLKNE